jgi:hypothetical protein
MVSHNSKIARINTILGSNISLNTWYLLKPVNGNQGVKPMRSGLLCSVRHILREF